MRPCIAALCLLAAACGTAQQSQPPARAEAGTALALSDALPVPVAPVEANLATTVRPAPLPPSPFAHAWTCSGKTYWGLQWSYEIYANAYGDIIAQAAVNDGNRTVTRMGFMGAETYRNRVAGGTRDRMVILPDFAKSNSNNHQTSLSFGSGHAVIADEAILYSKLTKQNYLYVNGTQRSECEPVTGPLLVGGQARSFGRIVRNALCATTIDAAVASYVDLTYQVAWDESGRTLVLGTASSREYGGIETDAIWSDSGAVGIATMNVPDSYAVGTYQVGYDPKTFSMSYGKDGDMQTIVYNPADYTTQNCLDWWPR